jgi:hypothetical protein
MTRSWWIALSLAATSITMLAAVACGGDDESNAGPTGADAASDVEVDADPCSKFTKSGEACNIPRSRVCFQLCDNGGCFCENGKWTCVNDTSCLHDADLGDVNLGVDDANVDDSATDGAADTGGDADQGDAPTDAPADAPADAPTDG